MPSTNTLLSLSLSLLSQLATIQTFDHSIADRREHLATIIPFPPRPESELVAGDRITAFGLGKGGPTFPEVRSSSAVIVRSVI